MAQLKVYITLAAGVTSASAVVADRKFNKSRTYSFQWDDGSRGIEVADALWSANYKYSDGCGNLRQWTGSVALNGGTSVPGSSNYNSQYYQQPALRALINKGHDIENHSFLHQGKSYNEIAGFTQQQKDDVFAKALQDTILEDDVIDLYVKYKMRSLVVPTDYAGYDIAAQSLGYLSCISQNPGVFKPGEDVIQFQIPTALGMPPDFYRLTRQTTDYWGNSDNFNSAVFPGLKSTFNEVIAGSRNFMVFFTHSSFESQDRIDNFVQYLNYIAGLAGDDFSFSSIREVLEYREMRRCPITQVLDGNTLVITIDTDNLDPRNRWKDLSFNITSDTAITDVTVDGFDSYTYNPYTKLVNVFLQKRIWGGAVRPGPTPDPVQQTLVKHGRFITA